MDASDVLLHKDIDDLLKMFTTPLLDDVDKVDEVSDVMLNPLTVLDEQVDVEVNLCDLL